MKQNNSNHDESNQSLLLVPKALLDSLVDGQNKILDILENKPEKELVGDFITEGDAQKLLGRKTTWFWNMRTNGLLPFSKVGNKIFYSKRDIQSLLENSKSKSE
jgi:hypothetical protein